MGEMSLGSIPTRALQNGAHLRIAIVWASICCAGANDGYAAMCWIVPCAGPFNIMRKMNNQASNAVARDDLKANLKTVP